MLMNHIAVFGLFGVALFAAGCSSPTPTSSQTPVERGNYLVTVADCGGCHTPGSMLGMPDMARNLGGSEVGFEIPGLGTFHPPNLTPDPETGLGKWSEQEIVTAITTGKRPDGRELAPIMPWRGLAALTPPDAMAVAVFLKSLPPVMNKVPGPFGPTEKATAFVMKVVAPEGATPPASALPTP
jgi:mono/diheme cytochrome c family protein